MKTTITALQEVIEALTDKFPNKLPKKAQEDIGTINVLIGQQQVIDYLSEVLERKQQ